MLKSGDQAPAFTFTDQWGQPRSSQEFAGRPLVLVFLRYAGCPICQLDLVSYTRSAATSFPPTAALLLVVQSEPERVKALAELTPGPAPVLACDPRAELYDLYGLRQANLLQYAGPAVLRKVGRAKAQGFTHGTREGREMQLPALFVIGADGRVRLAHYGRHIADLPEPREVQAGLEA